MSTKYYGFSIANKSEQPAWFHTEAAARAFSVACGFSDWEIETTDEVNASDVMDTAETPWSCE